MVFVRLLSKLLRDPEIGKLIVPIIPTKPAPSAWSAVPADRIYSSVALYEPVDMDTPPLLQGSEERTDSRRGITEAGFACARSSRQARPMQPRYQHDSLLIYYSMFGSRGSAT